MNDWFPYGLDAPRAARNLALIALACWVLFALSFTAWLPASVASFTWLVPALAFSIATASMAWSSRVGKLRRRERLLDQLVWRGDERVLDVGCGRGLLAVAAARRVPRGRVIGVDIWQAADLSGNDPAGVTANAAREGVSDRVETRTADMRELPFDDASIDLVVSSTAIHNIYQAEGRDRAIDEIARVVKPGGQVLIDDIHHLPQYAKRLRKAGFEVQLTHRHRTASWIWRVVSLGQLARGTLIGRNATALA